MFRTSFKPTDLPSSVNSVKLTKLNMSKFIPVDQFDGQEFCLNEAGWIRDSISMIARAQTMEEYQALVARLANSASSKSLPDGITDAEAFNMIKPRYSQSNTEIQQYIEFTNSSFADKVVEAAKKSASKSADSKNPAVSTSPDDSSNVSK